MQTFKSLEEARTVEAQRGNPFVEIHRISDTEWQAYEPNDPPPLDQQVQTVNTPV